MPQGGEEEVLHVRRVRDEVVHYPHDLLATGVVVVAVLVGGLVGGQFLLRLVVQVEDQAPQRPQSLRDLADHGLAVLHLGGRVLARAGTVLGRQFRHHLPDLFKPLRHDRLLCAPFP